MNFKFRTLLFLLVCCLSLSFTSIVSAQSVPGGPSDDEECRDAAGGIIPCPPTEVPSQPQPQPQPEEPRPEETPEAPEETGTTVNPLRPPTAGECQLATFGTGRVNVRVLPSFDAEIVAFLDPNLLYPVFAVVVDGGETWYQVASGWVAATATVLGGNCRNVPTIDTSSTDYPGARYPDFPFAACEYDRDAIIQCSVDERTVAWQSFFAEVFSACADPEDLTDPRCPAWADAWQRLYADVFIACADPEDLTDPRCPAWADAWESRFADVFVSCADDSNLPESLCPEGTAAWEALFADVFAACADPEDLTDPRCPAGTAAWQWLFADIFAACADPEDLTDPRCPAGTAAWESRVAEDFAACAYDENALIQCGPDEGASSGMVHMQRPTALAACAFDNDALVQCTTIDYIPMVVDEDFDFAACAFNPDAIIQCAPLDSTALLLPAVQKVREAASRSGSGMYDPDLPFAACAFDNDALVQCSSMEPYKVVFSDLIVSSATSTRPAGVWFDILLCWRDDTSDELTCVPMGTRQTREHVLLARQVNVP